MKVLTGMVREGAEKYMEAQKKLVEMTLEQLEKIGKTKAGHKEAGRKEEKPIWTELTEKSVKNLVTAEKSLLDLAMKTRKEAVHNAGPRGAWPESACCRTQDCATQEQLPLGPDPTDAA